MSAYPGERPPASLSDSHLRPKMNLVKNASVHPHLLDEEAVVVENAIRLAMDSIINVLYGVNSARNREYQRMVGDRDKEIQRLECRLREIEQELALLRRQGCACGLFGNEHGLGSQSTGDPPHGGQRLRECGDGDLTPGEQQCDIDVSLGVYTRTPSHVSSQSLEPDLPSSPSKVELDLTRTSLSAEAFGLSDTARNTTTSPCSILVKEEPCDIDTVFIKWEMSEERFREHQEGTDSPYQDKDGATVKNKPEYRQEDIFRARQRADAAGHQAAETEYLRNKKKSVPMSELPEEAQRLKRAAWRAASRRYYARKIARQQASPSHSGPFQHLTDSQYSQPASFTDNRKRTLISDLPQDSQALQREAWRASSRRYYARKTARYQPEATQYEHLLQSMEVAGENQGANRGGSQANRGGAGGILCS